LRLIPSAIEAEDRRYYRPIPAPGDDAHRTAALDGAATPVVEFEHKCTDSWDPHPSRKTRKGEPPSADHPGKAGSEAERVYSGELIPELTALAERLASVCPVCHALARKSCHCCADKFCNNHIYICAECDTPLCGECTDAHLLEGHASDSATAREMYYSITGGRK